MDSLVKINVGAAPNDGAGEPARDAFMKHNKNMDSIANALGAPGGFATLGADGRLLMGQFPLAAILPSSAHNLNSYTAPGIFFQPTVAQVTLAQNYPVAGKPGWLEVAGVSGSVATMQTYTVRNANVNETAKYWRVLYSGSAWTEWKQVADTTTAMVHQGFMAASQNLDDYRTRGIWNVSTAAIASGGTNFPIAQAGNFIVYAQVGPGQTPAGYVVQEYTAANANRTYTRVYSGTTWGAWVYNLDSSQVGSASGVASLDTSGRIPNTQSPYSAVIAAGTDANTLWLPGVYYVNSDAQATAALNWPQLLAGTLTVEAAGGGNAQVTQTYTTRNGTGGVFRTYKRVRFGASGGTWGTWQEVARSADLDAVSAAASTAVATARAVFHRGPGNGSWITTVPQFFIDACAGGGGGGGGAGFVGDTFRLQGAGGGAGEAMLGEIITAPVGTLVTWTVGSGGAGGAGGGVSGAGVGGGAGTNTVITINTSPVRTITLTRGLGGLPGATGGPALGGTGYPTGGAGFAGATASAAVWPQTGAGGSSPFGGGGPGVASLAGPVAGISGAGYGSGGGGGACPSSAGNTGGKGGDGRGGFLKIYW